MNLGAQLGPVSITKLSPNWACQMGPIHCPKFLLSGLAVKRFVPLLVANSIVVLRVSTSTMQCRAIVHSQLLLLLPGFTSPADSIVSKELHAFALQSA